MMYKMERFVLAGAGVRGYGITHRNVVSKTTRGRGGGGV